MKRELTDQENDSVAGGLDESGAITCENCGRTFQADDTFKNITFIKVGPGSYSGIYVWLCPGCGKWVNGFGKVIEI